tara:strand:+ start:271 stop:540 length:270 start_codon:yes stop_codon:yes gene_type:complete
VPLASFFKSNFGHLCQWHNFDCQWQKWSAIGNFFDCHWQENSKNWHKIICQWQEFTMPVAKILPLAIFFFFLAPLAIVSFFGTYSLMLF